MAKQWYFQAMGIEIGPLSSAELQQKVKLGQIQPDTPVRSGADGKWLAADRWKGLLPPPEPAPPPRTVVVKTAVEQKPAPADQPPHHNPKFEAPDDEDAPADGQYEFFHFVGFRQAITEPLYQALLHHAKQEGLTVTQVTRRALAKHIGKPELGDDQPPAAPTPAEEAVA